MIRLLLVLGAWLLCVTPIFALEFSAPTPIRPYEPISIGSDVETVREYYGKLTGDPIMYELMVRESGAIRVILDQPYVGTAPQPLRFLVVREISGGRLETVARSELLSQSWQSHTEYLMGFRWWRSELWLPDLSPGTYKVEVSSPQNLGSYRLTLGMEEAAGSYVGTWQRLWFVHEYYERPWWKFLGSLFVISHVVVLSIVVLLWWYGKRLRMWAAAGMRYGQSFLKKITQRYIKY